MSNPTDNLRFFLAQHQSTHTVEVSANTLAGGGGWYAQLVEDRTGLQIGAAYNGSTPNDAIDQLAGDEEVYALTKGY